MGKARIDNNWDLSRGSDLKIELSDRSSPKPLPVDDTMDEEMKANVTPVEASSDEKKGYSCMCCTIAAILCCLFGFVACGAIY